MDDYGNSTQSDKRTIIIRIAIGALLLAVVNGLLIWLFFFREPNVDTTKPTATSSTRQESSGDHATKNDAAEQKPATSTPAKPGAAAGSTQNQPSTPSNSTAPNGELSETGPGDVIALFVVAVIAGVALRRYQLRSR